MRSMYKRYLHLIVYSDMVQGMQSTAGGSWRCFGPLRSGEGYSVEDLSSAYSSSVTATSLFSGASLLLRERISVTKRPVACLASTTKLEVRLASDCTAPLACRLISAVFSPTF